jgi:FHA domain/B-box zinc finger
MAKLVIRTPGLPAEVINLKPGPNRLGRSAAADFQIFHDTLSRFHCEVNVKDDGMTVRDLDSSNGTFVNDQPVIHLTPLETGSLLRLGSVTLEVKDAPEPVSEEEVPACSNHPQHPASMICTQCRRVFCGTCIHILKRGGGKVLRLCPACSGHCVSLQGMNLDRSHFIGKFIKKLFKKKTSGTPFHGDNPGA